MPDSGGLEDSTGTGWDGEQHLLGQQENPEPLIVQMSWSKGRKMSLLLMYSHNYKSYSIATSAH